jgi:hypothetical protein
MDDENGQTIIQPEVGMCFESEVDAYNMYNTFARKSGFSVRKSDTKYRPSDKSLYSKLFVCNK